MQVFFWGGEVRTSIPTRTKTTKNGLGNNFQGPTTQTIDRRFLDVRRKVRYLWLQGLQVDWLFKP